MANKSRVDFYNAFHGTNIIDEESLDRVLNNEAQLNMLYNPFIKKRKKKIKKGKR